MKREQDSADDEIRQLKERVNELNAEAERERQITAGTAALRRVQADNAEAWLPSRRVYAQQEMEQRATGFPNAGAVLLTEQYSTWFDRLRTRSVVLAAGPRLIPVPGTRCRCRS